MSKFSIWLFLFLALNSFDARLTLPFLKNSLPLRMDEFKKHPTSPIMKLPFLLLLALTAFPAWANVSLPAIISNHMVLQKSAKARVWGKADPGEQVSVALDLATGKATAGPDGKWAVELNLSESKQGPFEMIVQGKNRIAIADVVVGEVWVASGQSNMEFPMKGRGDAIGADQEIAGSANPMLRQFSVWKAVSFEPLDQCRGEWIVAGPDATGKFTAVGYFFGKKLQKELQTPVGILHSNWGGTPVEAWTSQGALATIPDLKQSSDRQIAEFNAYPQTKAACAAAFGRWLADNAREDKPSADAPAYAGTGIAADGWVKIQLPGPVAAQGLPANGVIWLRKEIPIDAKQANAPLNLSLGSMEGFESIYWNGQFIKATTVKDFPEQNAGRNCTIPAELVREGKAVIAVRIYAPVSTPKFTNGGSLRAGSLWIGGEWLAKAELEFPALTPEKLAAAAPQTLPARMLQQFLPSSLFNGMISPLLAYSIRGAIWYQGESNAVRAWQYRTAFPLMIQDWRARWKQGDFPFYFCQLANFGGKNNQPGEAAWAELREAQAEALKLPQTGQAVLIDIGEAADIHPRNKQDVGDRLAAIALANDYGKAIPFSGPVYQLVKIENGKARLNFASVEGGLVAHPVPATYVMRSLQNETAPMVRNSPQSELEGFAICGEDKKWVWADAKIEGNTVLVWNSNVPAPVAVRYGWSGNPTCNLYNKAGFPASPFRTDDFPASTLNVKY
jgi:sialate O-acetylesterase